MNSEQARPDYKLYVHQHWGLGLTLSKRYLLRCQTRQAVWILKGLQTRAAHISNTV